MVDEPSDEAIARLLKAKDGHLREPREEHSRKRPPSKAGFSTGRRGRPPSGLADALKYSNRYWELRRAGMSRWHAKEEVARRTGRTVQHISQCVKTVEETDPYNYLGPDCPENW